MKEKWVGNSKRRGRLLCLPVRNINQTEVLSSVVLVVFILII